ncbi:MAG: hypothetical protein J2P55_06020 [Rhizobiales bacterium]|nr:hypothetical protein [Hyphomicrobiales bacterium]
MPALIAPASVASICAVAELLRVGSGFSGVGAFTGLSIGVGTMTRI